MVLVVGDGRWCWRGNRRGNSGVERAVDRMSIGVGISAVVIALGAELRRLVAGENGGHSEWQIAVCAMKSFVPYCPFI